MDTIDFETNVIKFFKPFLLSTFYEKDLNLDFCLAGITALEYYSENFEKFTTKTFPVEMYVWNKKCEKDTGNISKLQVMKNAINVFQEYFNEEVYDMNISMIRYFHQLSNKEYFSYDLSFDRGNIYLFGILICSFSYKCISSPYYYLTIPKVGYSPRIKFIEPSMFFIDQLSFFVSEEITGYYIEKNKNIIKEMIKSFGKFDPSIKNWYDFLLVIYQSMSENNFTDNFIRLHFISPPKEVKEKIIDVLNRIHLFSLTFDMKKIEEKEFLYKKDYTSCMTFILKNPEDEDCKSCVEKTKFGGEKFNSNYLLNFYNVPDNESLKEYIKKLNIELINNSKLDYKSDENQKLRAYHCKKEKDLNFEEDISTVYKKKPSKEEALCIWSHSSFELTEFMKKIFIAKMTGVKIDLKDLSDLELNYLDTIESLQKACNSLVLPRDIWGFKTGRAYVFGKGKNLASSLNFKEGDIIEQKYFNSACINPFYKEYLNFANHENGSCAYLIKIPKGTKCAYLGSDTKRTYYPSEYEILLPFDCKFRVIRVKRDNYIYSQNVFFKLTLYIVEYIPPSDNVLETLTIGDYLNSPPAIDKIGDTLDITFADFSKTPSLYNNKAKLASVALDIIKNKLEYINWTKNSDVNQVIDILKATNSYSKMLGFGFSVISQKIREIIEASIGKHIEDAASYGYVLLYTITAYIYSKLL